MMEPIDVSLALDDTHVVVTGAAGQIGTVIVRAFLSAGALVTAIDIKSAPAAVVHKNVRWHVADTTDEVSIEEGFLAATATFGPISACVAAAGLDLSFLTHHQTICDMPLDQFKTTINTNVTGTFLTARCWLRAIALHAQQPQRNVSLIIVGSEAGVLGVPGNVDYAASKAAVQYGLTKSLAPEAASIYPRARVNAIAPGAVDTLQFRRECNQDIRTLYQEAEATVAVRSPVPQEAVARTCLLLASDNFSSHVSGQVIQIDGGKSGRLLWSPSGTPSWHA